MEEEVTCRWDDVHVLLDQLAQFNVYGASSLKQQSSVTLLDNQGTIFVLRVCGKSNQVLLGSVLIPRTLRLITVNREPKQQLCKPRTHTPTL